MDSRVEKYRQARLMKRRCRLVFFFAFLILVLGVCAADYSINALVKNEKKINFVSFSKNNDYCYEASFLNVTFYIDTRKISRDLSGLRNKTKEIFSSFDLF